MLWFWSELCTGGQYSVIYSICRKLVSVWFVVNVICEGSIEFIDYLNRYVSWEFICH